MRKAPWAAVLLGAAILAGCVQHPEPSTNPPAPASPAPLEAPTNSSAVEPNGSTVAQSPARGASSATSAAACPKDGGCVGYFEWTDGNFSSLATATNASLRATWVPQSPLASRLIVSVLDGGNAVATARGESPLDLPMPSLLAGTYTVHVFPDGPAGAMVRQTVDWTVTFAPEP